MSRDNRLTLVIDETHGSPCRTYVADSSYTDLQSAMENLRSREGMMSLQPVGYIDMQSGDESPTARQRHPNVLERIRLWLERAEAHAVIWTALDSNFQEKAKRPYSTHAAIRHLQSLPPASLRVALEYIRNAPAEIQTALRAAVAENWPKEG